MIIDQIELGRNLTVPPVLFWHVPNYLSFSEDEWYQLIGGQKRYVLKARVRGFDNPNTNLRLGTVLNSASVWFWNVHPNISQFNMGIRGAASGEPIEVATPIALNVPVKHPISSQPFNKLFAFLGTYAPYTSFVCDRIWLEALDFQNYNPGTRHNYPARLS